jgi:hypothetical protein
VKHIPAGLVVNNVLILGVGVALLYALGLARFRLGEWRLLALAYLLGWALLGSALTFLLIAGIGPSVVTVVLVAAAIAVACFFVGRRVPKTEIVAIRPRGHPLAVLTALTGAVVLAGAAVTALIVAVMGTWPSEWDVWGFWLPKAKSIYYLEGLDTGLGGYGAQSHPEYPPLVPAMNAATSHFVGAFHPSLLNIQVVLLGVAFLGAVPALLDRFVPRWLSFPLLALLAVSPGFWWRMQSMMADQTVAYLIAAAAVAGVIWLCEPRGAWLGVALVLLVAATLTKLEGATLGLLLVVVVVAAAFTLHGRKGWPALLLLLGPAAIEPWRLWLGSHGLPVSATDYHASDLLRLDFLADRTSRFTYAFDWMLHSVFRTGEWLVVLPLALIAIVLAARRLPVIAAAFSAWIVIAFLGLTTIYWIGIPDVHWYVQTSADRVASTIVIVAGTLTPLLLGIALAERRHP